MARRMRSTFQYRFKVNFKRRRSIWRSVVLRGDQTLDDLHEMIFSAFDRGDPHLYCFYFPNKAACRSQSGKQSRSYISPEAFEPSAYDNQESADSATLDELRFRAGQTFEYVFDFGDQWWHEITVEDIGPTESGAPYPRIVARKGDSPPQYPEAGE